MSGADSSEVLTLGYNITYHFFERKSPKGQEATYGKARSSEEVVDEHGN